MVTTAASVEWTVVRTEVEALAARVLLDQGVRPALQRQVPRRQVLPLPRRDDGRGVPAGPGHARRQAQGHPLLRALRPRVGDPRDPRPAAARLPGAHLLRPACSSARTASGRPCLLGYIDKCSAPCVGRVTPDEHRAIAEDFCDFMAGDTTRFAKRLETRMKEAAAELDFEQAARLRDDIGALTKALEKQAVVLGDATDADVFALADDDLEAAVQVFHVRGGRIRGQRGWVVEKEARTSRRLVEHLLLQVYGDAERDADPPRGARPALPADVEAVTEWLSSVRGSAVSVRVPQRGDKRTLMETVRRNAEQSLARHKVARAGDLTTAQQGAAGDPGLPRPRRRAAAHRVLRRHPRPGHQRRRVDGRLRGRPRAQERVPPVHRPRGHRGDEGGEPVTVDDTAAMHEVLTRRFRRYLEDAEGAGDLDLSTRGRRRVVRRARPRRSTDDDDEPSASGPIDPETGRPRRFAYPPSLVVVDGGLPQVNAAAGGARRARHRGRRARRARQAPRGGVAARATTTRSSCRARARASTCCSGCATRPTGSRSPSTASGGRKAHDDVPARRHTRARRQPPEGAAAPLRFGQTPPRGGHRRTSWPYRASAGRLPRPSSATWLREHPRSQP